MICGHPIPSARSAMLSRITFMAILWGASMGVACSQDVHFGEEAFDKTTFSQMTQLEARQKCDEALDALVRLTNQTVDLSATQRDKLRTAGQLDIHRFFARYEAVKRRIPFGNVPRDQWQQLSAKAHASARPLSRQYLQGLHGDGSLLEKTLDTSVEPDKVARIRQASEDAARALYLEQIDSALLVIGRQVRLTPEQRDAIRQTLLTQTDPPAIFGTSLMPLYFVLANMGEVEPELRGLFSDQDWRTIQKLIEAGQTATR